MTLKDVDVKSLILQSTDIKALPPNLDSFSSLVCKTFFARFFSLASDHGIYGLYFVNYIIRTYFTGLAQFKIGIVSLGSLESQPGGSAKAEKNIVIKGFKDGPTGIKKKKEKDKLKKNLREASEQDDLVYSIKDPDPMGQLQKFKILSNKMIKPIEGLNDCIASQAPEFITSGNLVSNHDKLNFMDYITNALFDDLKAQIPAAAAAGGRSKYINNQINKTLKIKNFKNYKNNETKKFRKS
mgnify:FL=1